MQFIQIAKYIFEFENNTKIFHFFEQKKIFIVGIDSKFYLYIFYTLFFNKKILYYVV